MPCDRVTFTGADDSVCADDLVQLAMQYPFIEWGILLSSQRVGMPRFPSYAWLRDLQDRVRASSTRPRLSAHLCGRWIRDICHGNWSWMDCLAYEDIGPTLFERVQLNFHGMPHTLEPAAWEVLGVKQRLYAWQIILQCDGVNDPLLWQAPAGIYVVPLFDRSHGTGVMPTTWPTAPEKTYCGYAGGLGPESLARELPGIAWAAQNQDFWIDMETKIRSSDDGRFRLDLVDLAAQVMQKYGTVRRAEH